MGLPNNRSKTVQLFDLGIDGNFGFHSIFDGRKDAASVFALMVKGNTSGLLRQPSPKRVWNSR